jgi:hypothetical protein
MKIEDEQLAAYVDGELDADARAAVEAAVAADPVLAARLARQRALLGSLRAVYDPVLDEPVPERLLAALRPAAPAMTAIGGRAAPRRAVRRLLRRNWPQWGAIAAAVAVGILIGASGWLQYARAPLATVDGRLLARDGLAQALNAQLASAQAADAPVRIGVSFKAKSGEYCRTFALAGSKATDGAMDGLACRAGAGWRVRLLAQAASAAAPSGGYRTAASSMAAPILRAVDESIDGAPLDAAGERAAQRAGWGGAQPPK